MATTEAKLCPRCKQKPTSRADTTPVIGSIVIIECRPCMWDGPGYVYFSGFGKGHDEAAQAWNKWAGEPYRECDKKPSR